MPTMTGFETCGAICLGLLSIVCGRVTRRCMRSRTSNGTDAEEEGSPGLPFQDFAHKVRCVRDGIDLGLGTVKLNGEILELPCLPKELNSVALCNMMVKNQGKTVELRPKELFIQQFLMVFREAEEAKVWAKQLEEASNEIATAEHTRLWKLRNIVKAQEITIKNLTIRYNNRKRQDIVERYKAWKNLPSPRKAISKPEAKVKLRLSKKKVGMRWDAIMKAQNLNQHEEYQDIEDNTPRDNSSSENPSCNDQLPEHLSQDNYSTDLPPYNQLSDDERRLLATARGNLHAEGVEDTPDVGNAPAQSKSNLDTARLHFQDQAEPGPIFVGSAESATLPSSQQFTATAAAVSEQKKFGSGALSPRSKVSKLNLQTGTGVAADGADGLDKIAANHNLLTGLSLTSSSTPASFSPASDSRSLSSQSPDNFKQYRRLSFSPEFSARTSFSPESTSRFSQASSLLPVLEETGAVFRPSLELTGFRPDELLSQNSSRTSVSSLLDKLQNPLRSQTSSPSSLRDAKRALSPMLERLQNQGRSSSPAAINDDQSWPQSSSQRGASPTIKWRTQVGSSVLAASSDDRSSPKSLPSRNISPTLERLQTMRRPSAVSITSDDRSSTQNFSKRDSSPILEKLRSQQEFVLRSVSEKQDEQRLQSAGSPTSDRLQRPEKRDEQRLQSSGSPTFDRLQRSEKQDEQRLQSSGSPTLDRLQRSEKGDVQRLQSAPTFDRLQRSEKEDVQRLQSAWSDKRDEQRLQSTGSPTLDRLQSQHASLFTNKPQTSVASDQPSERRQQGNQYTPGVSSSLMQRLEKMDMPVGRFTLPQPQPARELGRRSSIEVGAFPQPTREPGRRSSLEVGARLAQGPPVVDRKMADLASWMARRRNPTF